MRSPNPDVPNVSLALREKALRFPERIAVQKLGKRPSAWTFATLEERCNRIADGLRNAGLVPGDRVSLFVPPSAEMICLTHALFRVGALPVLIDPGMGRRNLLACIEHTAPRALIGIARAQLARRLFPRAFKSVELFVGVGRPRLGATPLEAIESRGRTNGETPIHEGRPDDPACILFTSGSTGPPKGVVATHRVFNAQLRALEELYELREGEVDVACFPLFALFDNALGMTSVFPDMDPTKPARCDPAKIHAAIEDSGATFTFGSPAIWRRILAWARTHDRRFSRLRRITIAGAPVPPWLLCGLRELLPENGDVYTPYGATEALPVSSLGAREMSDELRGRVEGGEGTCVGRPAPGIEIAIVPITEEAIAEWSDDLRLPPGHVGEICVRGDVTTPEYLFHPEPTRLAKIPYRRDDGSPAVWHRMGDVGRFDGEGRLWFLGRKSHRLRTDRGLLFPVPLENAFNVCQDVHRTALVGVGAAGRERPHLIVELEPGADRSRVEAALKRRSASLDEGTAIEGILFHDAFPVDVRHNAKIHRLELKRWAEEELSASWGERR